LGFLNAVREIGCKRLQDASLYRDADLRLLQLPLVPSPDTRRRQYAIIVGLEVDDPVASVLHIRGVEKIELRDYLAENENLDEQKRRYCYKEPAGANVTWSYSPVYQLGRPKKNSINQLLGSDGRLAKFRRTVLDDYERSGVFLEGSVDLIMDQLNKRAEDLAQLWSDSEADYILVLGVFDRGKLLYPGDVPAFVRYYKGKLQKQIYDSAFKAVCGLCHTPSDRCINLDQVFAFATFDKPGFLPGTRNTAEARSKVFPVCSECLSALHLGREYLDLHFCDRRTIRGVNIYVAPELIFGSGYFDRVARAFHDFLNEGLPREGSLFQSLARRDESLVFHFVFWEKQQAQERIHLMVEDVPPSRLKKLESKWVETAEAVGFSDERRALDHGLGEVVRAITSLAGDNEQDERTMRMYAISVIGKLLNDEPVDIKTLKTILVSRLPGLVHDDEWLRYGAVNSRRLAAVVDFINRCARRD